MDFRERPFNTLSMEANTGSGFTNGPADVTVELSAAEAAAGTTKTIAAPPDGRPVLVYLPPGAPDGAMVNVDLPWIDPATGTAATRTVRVAIRVVPAGPFPGADGPPPRRFGTRTRIIAVAAGIALVGGLCLVPTLFRRSDADTAGSSTGTTFRATEAVVPAAPALDPAAYQASLDDADKQLTAAVRALRAATTPRTVASTADALAEAVRTQASTLSGLTVPAGVSTAHGDVVSALSALETALTSVSSSADSRSVCTGSSAGAKLGRDRAAAGLRKAVAALAAADPVAKYRFGSFLPAAAADQNRRRTNGSYLTRPSGGSGELKVNNGNPADTVINLVKAGAKKSTVSVYIRARKKITAGRIKDGTYHVYMSSGTDWDGRRFTRNCQFSKFDSDLKFTTTSRQYTIWELSLKVLGGNATSSDVDPEEFPS
jgi:hypothetical protein